MFPLHRRQQPLSLAPAQHRTAQNDPPSAGRSAPFDTHTFAPATPGSSPPAMSRPSYLLPRPVLAETVHLSSETGAAPSPATPGIFVAPNSALQSPPRITARPSRENHRIPSRHPSSSASPGAFSVVTISINSRAVRFVALTLDRLQKLKYHRIVIPNDLLTSSSNSDSANRSDHCGNQIGSSCFAFVGML